MNIDPMKLTRKLKDVGVPIEQGTAIVEVNMEMQQDLATKSDIDDVNKRIDGVEQRLDGVEQRLDGVEQRLGGVEQRLGGVEEDLKETNKVLTDLRVEVARQPYTIIKWVLGIQLATLTLTVTMVASAVAYFA